MTPAPELTRSKGTWLLVVWIGAALALAYWPALSWLAGRYEAADSFYAHGPLVPLASAFLVYRKRAALCARARPGSWWSLAVIVPALLLHVASTGLRAGFPSGVSLWLLVVGSVWLLFGAAVLRGAAFALAFLLFAIPLPMVLIAHAAQLLKSWVMFGAHGTLSLLQTGVTAEGSYLILPGGGQLLVDDECCGLRSLVALVALGALMAGTSAGGSRARAMLLGLAFPIALVANLLRVLTLSFVALAGGTEAARRWHDPSGYAVYVVAIVLYVLVDRVLSRRKEAPA